MGILVVFLHMLTWILGGKTGHPRGQECIGSAIDKGKKQGNVDVFSKSFYVQYLFVPAGGVMLK